MLKHEIQYKEDSPEISQLCRDLAKFVDEKCWAKLTHTDMVPVPLRCSIFAPGVQRTRQFEIEQHGTGTR